MANHVHNLSLDEQQLGALRQLLMQALVPLDALGVDPGKEKLQERMLLRATLIDIDTEIEEGEAFDGETGEKIR